MGTGAFGMFDEDSWELVFWIAGPVLCTVL